MRQKSYAACVTGLGAVVIAFGLINSALAQFEIEEPEVEKGEVEVEYQGAYHSGLPEASDEEGLENEVIRHGTGLEVGIGLTNYLSLGLQVEFEEERGEDGRFSDFDVSEIGFESRLVLLPINGDGFGSSLFFEFEKTIGDGEEGKKIGIGPILKTARGPLSATANLFFSHNFDVSEENIEDGEVEIERTPNHWNFEYAWQVKYQLNDKFGLGAEGYGEFADIGSDIDGDNPDKHRIGPVIYIHFGDGEGDDAERDDSGDKEEGAEVAAALGILFGLNDTTSDIAVKWNLEVEF